MNQQTKLLFIAASFAALSGCGGGGTNPTSELAPTPASASTQTPAPAPAPAPALAPISAPDYVATDAFCVAVLVTAGTPATAGKIDDVAAYFGSYSVSLTSGGTATFTIQHPGTVTLKGVTTTIKSVCFSSAGSANWRYVSLVDGNTMNLDTATTTGAMSCANGGDFSVNGPRGIFSGCKP
jgi:hypothetical protein